MYDDACCNADNRSVSISFVHIFSVLYYKLQRNVSTEKCIKCRLLVVDNERAHSELCYVTIRILVFTRNHFRINTLLWVFSAKFYICGLHVW